MLILYIIFVIILSVVKSEHITTGVKASSSGLAAISDFINDDAPPAPPANFISSMASTLPSEI